MRVSVLNYLIFFNSPKRCRRLCCTSHLTVLCVLARVCVCVCVCCAMLCCALLSMCLSVSTISKPTSILFLEILQSNVSRRLCSFFKVSLIFRHVFRECQVQPWQTPHQPWQQQNRVEYSILEDTVGEHTSIWWRFHLTNPLSNALGFGFVMRS